MVQILTAASNIVNRKQSNRHKIPADTIHISQLAAELGTQTDRQTDILSDRQTDGNSSPRRSQSSFLSLDMI